MFCGHSARIRRMYGTTGTLTDQNMIARYRRPRLWTIRSRRADSRVDRRCAIRRVRHRILLTKISFIDECRSIDQMRLSANLSAITGQANEVLEISPSLTKRAFSEACWLKKSAWSTESFQRRRRRFGIAEKRYNEKIKRRKNVVWSQAFN